MAQSEIKRYVETLEYLAGSKTFIDVSDIGHILYLGNEDEENKKACIFFSNQGNNTDFPSLYGSGILIRSVDANRDYIIYLSADNPNNFYWGYRITSGGTTTITWKTVVGTSA